LSVENRGENKWRFRVRKDGISYTQTFYGTEKEAKDEHKKFEVDVMRGNIGSNENMKYSELAQSVLDDYIKPNLRASSQASYITMTNNHILTEFGDMKISKIKTLHIQKMINKKSKTLKPNTVATIYRELNKTFNKAIQWGLLKENPCKNIKLPKTKKVNYRELLSSEDISKLVVTINNQPIMYKAVFSIAIYSGMRQGEILGLKISDINLAEKTINVSKQHGRVMKDGKMIRESTDTKTDNSVRIIYIPDFLAEIIKEYINSMKVIPTDGTLFYNVKWKKIYGREWFTEKFGNMLAENSIPHIRFHDMRHLYATMAINAGTNVVAVAKTMGDTVETVLKNYTHGIEEEQQKATYNFEEYVKNL